MERPYLGFPFARSAAAEANYSCVQIGHTILRRHPITGAVQRGNSVTHFVADASHKAAEARHIFQSGSAGLDPNRKAACGSTFRWCITPFKAAQPARSSPLIALSPELFVLRCVCHN